MPAQSGNQSDLSCWFIAEDQQLECIAILNVCLPCHDKATYWLAKSRRSLGLFVKSKLETAAACALQFDANGGSPDRALLQLYSVLPSNAERGTLNRCCSKAILSRICILFTKDRHQVAQSATLFVLVSLVVNPTNQTRCSVHMATGQRLDLPPLHLFHPMLHG